MRRGKIAMAARKGVHDVRDIAPALRRTCEATVKTYKSATITVWLIQRVRAENDETMFK